MKIVNKATECCVRYVFVQENSTTTVSQIPQGEYYLKLSYGYDWMEYSNDGILKGKFTRNVVYEISQDVFDFGKKNSLQVINYSLKINVENSTLMNNFRTKEIGEAEFFNEIHS